MLKKFILFFLFCGSNFVLAAKLKVEEVKPNDPKLMYSLPLETGMKSFSCDGLASTPKNYQNNTESVLSAKLSINCTYAKRECQVQFFSENTPTSKKLLWKKPIEKSMMLFSDMYLSQNRVKALRNARKTEDGWVTKTEKGTAIKVNKNGTRMWVNLNGLDYVYRLGHFDEHTVVTGTKLAMNGNQVVTTYTYQKKDNILFPNQVALHLITSEGSYVSGLFNFSNCKAF